MYSTGDDKMEVKELFSKTDKGSLDLSRTSLIESETEMDIALVHATVPEVLVLISSYFSSKDFLKIRLLNQGTQSLFLHSPQSQLLALKLKGPRNFSTDRDVQMLIASKIRWKSIRFTSVPLNTFFFEDIPMFNDFITKYSTFLSRVTISNCLLTMGRFIEFVSHFKLDHLAVHNSPTLFQTDMQICKWDEFVPIFIKVVENLKEFELLGNIRESNVETLLEYTRNLQRLWLISTTHPVSSYAIRTAIKNNELTLTTLFLGGHFTVDLAIIESLSKLKLISLTLCVCEISNGTAFAKFLDTQLDSLKTLVLKSMSVPDLPIQKDFGLTGLRLENCDVVRVNWTLFKSLSALKSLKSIYIGSTTNDHRDLVIRPICDLFANPLPELATLKFQHLPSLNVLLSHINPQSCPNLVSLSIISCGISSVLIRHIWKLVSLEQLVMRNCTLGNSHFEPRVDHGPSHTCLTDLKKLKLLELSSNEELSDAPMMEHISLLPNLEYLHLNNTKVTRAGLQALVEKVNGSNASKALKSISATGCQLCSFSSTECRAIIKKASPVLLDVDIRLDIG